MACVGGGESCKFVIWAPTRVYPTQCLGGLWASIAAQVIGVMVVKSKSAATGQKYVKQREVHHGKRSRHCAKHVTFADRDTQEESQAQDNLWGKPLSSRCKLQHCWKQHQANTWPLVALPSVRSPPNTRQYSCKWLSITSLP